MNKTIIKELQKLMALCMKINDRTEHTVFFEFYGHVNRLCIKVDENGWTKTRTATYITDVGGDKPTLPNINKCRQKLLKYKEW